MFSIFIIPPTPLAKGGVETETFILGESKFPLLVPPLISRSFSEEVRGVLQDVSLQQATYRSLPMKETLPLS
jgi:hypothetical protein